MKKIGRVLKRTLRSEFGIRKNPLPNKLSFLSSIPFYAVTECQPPESSVSQTRIEILPSSLKNIAGSHEKYKKLKKLHKKTLSKLFDARKQLTKQQEHMGSLEKVNKQLLKNLGEGPRTPEPEIKSNLQKIDESGIIPRGPAVQGGLPSLGKKR